MTRMPTFTPTDEQQAITDASLTGKNLVIQAGAGTGKSRSLQMVAESDLTKSITYLVYNKAAATDAQKRMPPNSSCSTAHSLAFRTEGKKYAHRIKADKLPPWEIATVLGIDSPLILSKDLGITPAHRVRIARDTVTRFSHSDADEITTDHVPYQENIRGKEHRNLAEASVPLANEIWKDALNTDGILPYEHDFYVKSWALTDPTIRGDVIMLDEGQDTNPVLASVIRNQTQAQRIVVGDSNQQLYEWRGARDALRGWGDATELYLSQSWRFGDAVAEKANIWLEMIGTRLRLTGNPGIDSVVGPLDQPSAFLHRTNAGCLITAMRELAANRRVAIVGGGAALASLARAAQDLQGGRRTNHPDLFAFSDWGEVQAYIADGFGADLKTFVELVDKHGPARILAAINALDPESRADVVVSTCHRAKGRQWPSVTIGNDFKVPHPNVDFPISEWMLNYVGVTRAQYQLDPGVLDWTEEMGQKQSAQTC